MCMPRSPRTRGSAPPRSRPSAPPYPPLPSPPSYHPLQELVRAEGGGGGGGAGALNAKLWAEALVRRQEEEAAVHARRLRHEAHAAASGTLTEPVRRARSGGSNGEGVCSHRAPVPVHPPTRDVPPGRGRACA